MTALTLAAATSAVRQARDFARECCTAAGLSPDITQTVVLLTSETVTNAFVHDRSNARLAVTLLVGRVLVEVGDDNSRHPHAVEDDDEAQDGRGLLLMNGLAHSWGVRDDRIGKTVSSEVLR